MDGKYVLIALVVACTHELGHSHILPPSHDFPIAECVRSLTRHMINMCSSYGDYADMFIDNGMPLIPQEEATIRRWELREKIIKACCTRPCSASEIYAIC
ncbi:uncharacterized protein LOC114365615 [Ostrinia furnacalis]|uniref:uncharacterized protein LOC114365615 n=1 Tax=Ostrinia furnacalis TaxID=93504 RepID=UPI00103E3CA0|nr:uncharacterized protein LOC114365615 [Ostrinia furnacalis]